MVIIIIPVILVYTTHKNTNKQNKYLFIHFENPSPHKTADDQFHFDQ